MGNPSNIPEELIAYDAYIEGMREAEYPMLKDAVYLDHAGTTLCSKTLLQRFHSDMLNNLYGNPHSASSSSQHTTREIESARLELLRFFNADPEVFDLVFTANATAAVKLVGDALRETRGGFEYGYHVDSHTSLVGLREYAVAHECFETMSDLDAWTQEQTGMDTTDRRPRLITFPLQSNMNGRRLPIGWTCGSKHDYVLVDAAAHASTSALDLENSKTAPEFTVLSLYKIFGFPDLGALIVKKDIAYVLATRRYFGGGTVDMVVSLREQWHARKSASLHEQVEDGTLPIHNIVALKSAVRSHRDLFGTLDRISRHTARLATKLYEDLRALKHGNDQQVCTIYKHPDSQYGDVALQGPIVSFNIKDSKGQWISNAEVEKLSIIRNIHLRTGGVCNPGGIVNALELEPWEIRDNFSSGHRCGGENDILNGKPTGVIRASLGAMSTMSDVERFVGFISEFFVDKSPVLYRYSSIPASNTKQSLHVESLVIYPIKSCGGWPVPPQESWEIRSEGLAWDREWCVVHRGTGKALSQKQYPSMALIRPRLDFKAGKLHIEVRGDTQRVSVPLSRDPKFYQRSERTTNAIVCGDPFSALMYQSNDIGEFLTKAVGVDCTLARFSPNSGVSRHSKTHLLSPAQLEPRRQLPPIHLSNESPILTISRSSLNRLNEEVKAKGGTAALPSVFRPNIILTESCSLPPGQEQPWAEDYWQQLQIGTADGPLLEVLGGCKRCQMVCIDQETAKRNAEPFVTLAKTRRVQGRVLFGVHTALVSRPGCSSAIIVGDLVEALSMGDTDML